ncbi:MAG TPA: hypothetical protein VEV63_06780 [Streptosporangiaceae bacterium]|nr:hypothetical protein [Streptosporangiaceae bacterium]
MFATHQLELPVSLAVAQARLAGLADEGGLRGASLQSYEGGVEHLVRAGPIPKLVRIRFLDPVYRDHEMSLGLRWEATGVAGGLFPVLDADITVTRSGDETTTLSLVGSYRPPLGALGATLDKAILNQVAAATIRALLRDVADTITRDGEHDSRDDDDEDADPRRHCDA